MRDFPVLTVEARPRWHDQAVCAQTDPDAFFPEKGGSARPAKAVCAVCPVRRPCLEWALEHDERHGVWGGLSERQRRGLRPERPPTCRNGLHVMTAENTYTYPNGWKTCRACKDARHEERRQEGKAAALCLAMEPGPRQAGGRRAPPPS